MSRWVGLGHAPPRDRSPLWMPPYTLNFARFSIVLNSTGAVPVHRINRRPACHGRILELMDASTLRHAPAPSQAQVDEEESEDLALSLSTT